jgi:hypothetical protein
LGMHALDIGDYEEAIARLSQAVRVAPDWAQAHRALSYARALRSQLNRASLQPNDGRAAQAQQNSPPPRDGSHQR